MQKPTAEQIASEPGKRPERVPSNSVHAAGGRIRSQKHSIGLLKIILHESGEEIAVNAQGEFSISWRKEGEYHLDILANGRVIKQHKIRVPSSNYEIEV